MESNPYAFTPEELELFKPNKTPTQKPKLTVVPTSSPGSLPVNAVSDQYSDMRLSAAFAEMFHDEIRFWPEVGKWLIFDGRRWTSEAPGGAFPFVRRMIEALYQQAMDCIDYAQRGEMLKAILKLESHPRQETILAAAKTRPSLIISAAQLDQHPMLLTVNNGTLDLRSGLLRPHQASDFITRMVSVDYDPSAICPLWAKSLDRIFNSNDKIMGYLQRFTGYCLTGRTDEQVLLFLYGLGCNGKSVLANVIGDLLGDHSSTANASLLMAQDNRTSSNDVAALRGARLVKVSEFDDGERLAESQIKTLTGGDAVTCRFLYCEHFTYVPTYKILLIGNHKPKVRGTDHGIWRRLHMLPFDVTIPADERDPELQAKLIKELPGILAWAVRGCLEWQRLGLSAPDEILSATDSYRKSEDIFQQWLEECCIQDVNAFALSSDLLTSFIEYSRWRSTTPKKLGQMLSDAGFTDGKSNGCRGWRGLGIIQKDNRHWQDKD